MLGVFGRQERALVMIEPPGEVGITRIFEIYNGVFVAIEKLVLEKLRSFMRHSGVHEFRAGMKNALHEAAEESRRRCAVEAVIVIKDAYAHDPARMENLLECTKRAGNATEPWNLTGTARGPGETVKVACRQRGNVVGRHAAHLRQTPGCFNHKGRLVALPAVWN